MIDRIKIKKPKDLIIVDKCDSKYVFAGSKCFCGMCGNPIGVLTKRLKFPYTSGQFLEALKNRNVDSMVFGLRHRTCGHTMFSFNKSWTFIGKKEYKILN